MKKRLFIPVILIFFFLSSSAQFDTVFAKRNIRSCADSMSAGFKVKNWNMYARYVNPAMIGSMGGKAEFMAYMDKSFSEIPVNAWKKYEPGKILQVIKTEGDLQTVVELKSILEWQGRRISTTTHLIGQSWDGGLFWTFFDSEGDREIAKLIKPDLSDQLIIPLKKENVESINAVPKKKQ